MADQTINDTFAHNAVLDVNTDGFDLTTINTFDWNDYVKLSGGGEATVNLGVGNDTLDARHAWGPVTANGGTGSDVMLGGWGNDHFDGGNNNDFLKGGGGDDWLDGGRARDVLTGGDGADTFHFTREGIYNQTDLRNSDVVTDFKCEDNPLEFAGWGTGLHWDSSDAWFKDAGNNFVAHLNGYEGVELARVDFDPATHIQHWDLV